MYEALIYKYLPEKTGAYIFSFATTKEKQKIPLPDFLYLLIHTSALPRAACVP